MACESVHVTEVTSQLLVKVYVGWSNIKEDSGRREERKRGKELRAHLNFPQISFRPKQPGQWNQADLSNAEDAHWTTRDTLSAPSFRPVVTMWLKLPGETP